MWYYFCIFFAVLLLVLVNPRTEHTASEPNSIPVFYKKNCFDKNMFTYKYYFNFQKKTNFISAFRKIYIQILNSQHTLQNMPIKHSDKKTITH